LRHPTFKVVTSVEEARRVIAADRIAVFVGLEGADVIESPDDVDRLFALGVRVMSLAHFVDTPLLDAEDGQFGPLLAPVTNGSTKGVTPLGLAVSRRDIERGVLLDVTHASPMATASSACQSSPMVSPLVILSTRAQPRSKRRNIGRARRRRACG
jgi:microsomal dipeptidase-like Zn-dependent dipeptidase